MPFQKGFAANLCFSFASLSIGTVIFVLETLNRGLPLELALPSSTISGWHRKLLSSWSSSSQFTRSLYLSVRPSYNLRSCLISSVMSSLISQFRDSKMRTKNTNSRQILSERASNRSATSNSSVKILCLNSS